MNHRRAPYDVFGILCLLLVAKWKLKRDVLSNTISRMIALSFWQPYAWFIVNGHADVDSRTWAPPQKRIGQRMAIHASKRKLTATEFEEFLSTVKELGLKNYPKSRDDFDYGKIVGTVLLSGVSKNSKSPFAYPGYFHWQLSQPKKIKPIALRGRQGWFTISEI